MLLRASLRIFIVFSLVLALSTPIYAAQDITTKAKQAIIIDYDTGLVLFEKNADERMPTSSMSKVMTMYLVFDTLKKGDLALDDELLVSEKAWKKKGSKMFVPVGKKVRVEDLIRGVIIQSGNDATIVLAEGIGGAEDAFAAALTRQAKELGMNNSNFVNASGWPDDNHYSTARDLSILARSMISEFPEYYGYYAEKSFSYNNIEQGNRNPLLYKDIGADGLKTGHTEIGGYGLIGTGVKDGRRVIMVLNGMESSKERSTESVRLLQWALNGYKNISLFTDTEKALSHLPVVLGQDSKLAIGSNVPLTLTVEKLFADDIEIDLEYATPIKAPIQKGDVVGKIKISVPRGEVRELPLIALGSIEELGFFAKTIEKMRLLASGEGTIH